MKKIKRIAEVLTKEGLLTFAYLVRANLLAKQSPQKKYRRWIKYHEREIQHFTGDTFFSIVQLGSDRNMADRQAAGPVSYDNWELIAADENMTLAECLKQMKGDYAGFVCDRDKLAEHALCRLASVIDKEYYRGKEVFYSDEDKMTADGKRSNPFFKPDYSPDTLRSFFYMGGFLVMKKELLERLVYCMHRPIRYGAYLLALEASLILSEEKFCHISEILYHRSADVRKPAGAEAAADKEQLLRQYGILAVTEPVEDFGEARVVYELEHNPPVSIIIPSKDNPDILQVCLDSIHAHTVYTDYEIVVVDNGSLAENKKIYEELCQKQKVSCRYYYEPMEFNFSRMCNIGAAYAKGEYYLFLNDDIEIKALEGKDWLTRLVGQAVQPHTGVVGAKLMYPASNRIQHVGVVNYESGAAHILSKAEDDKPLLFGRNRMDYNYSVVTGACFLVSREKFQQAGGFEEQLAVTFNDVELCFRILKMGYYNVVRNDVVLYHHESITRGEDAIDPKKYLRHLKEREKLFAMQPSFVKKDACYSVHLTQKELDGSVNAEYKPKNFAVEPCDGKNCVSVRQCADERDYGNTQKISLAQRDAFTCVIEYAQAEEKVCIRGFAFSEAVKHNNFNRITLLLKGNQEILCVKTMKIYNPTIAPQMESRRNLNFVEFYTTFSREKLQEKQYQIGISVKCPGQKKPYVKMTETWLTICGNY